MKSAFLFLLPLSALAIALGSVAFGDEGKKARNGNDVDAAFAEFKVAAERLGHSMAKAADENTAEARQHILKTMSGAIHELSQSMNQASRSLESAVKPKRGSSAKPKAASDPEKAAADSGK